jgi:Ca-activated chloride channel family protein
MSTIAGDGAGGYYYLRDSEQIAPALALELDKRLEPVATAVEVRVRVGDKIELLRVYGSRRLGGSRERGHRAAPRRPRRLPSARQINAPGGTA